MTSLDFTQIRKKFKFFQKKNLENFYKNLKALWILSCELKEIFQLDLRKFPKLVYIQLLGNKIEIIEEGLFAFNPNLEVIGFRDNKLVHIDPNVFDNLSKLSHFWFSNATCVNYFVSNSKAKVREALSLVKKQCVSSEVVTMDKDTKNLKIGSANVKIFAAKVRLLRKNLETQNFLNFGHYGMGLMVLRIIRVVDGSRVLLTR